VLHRTAFLYVIDFAEQKHALQVKNRSQLTKTPAKLLQDCDIFAK